MSQGTPAIIADDLYLSYEIRSSRKSSDRNVSHVQALSGVSFRVDDGEMVGVIGRNGAGKSTLMKVLMGVLRPDQGTVRASSIPSVLSLSGVLTARYTGRVNIQIGLLTLGWSPVEIDEKIPSIIEFSELGSAIDRPVGTYSSGMMARLKFAIATSIEPKILLIDEALAVGDKSFRDKSHGRLAELTATSSSIVLVTHSLSIVKTDCDRAVWLDQGAIRKEGDPVDVVDEYIQSSQPAVK